MIALMKRVKAAEMLAQLEHLEAKSYLSHSDLHKRDKCIGALIAMGSVVVPQLVRRLAKVRSVDPSAPVAMILQQIGDEAVPWLAKAMHDRDCHRRHNAISLLGRIATPAAVSALDDETVDLMDMEILQHARQEAGKRGHPEGTSDLWHAPAEGSSGQEWLPRENTVF
jgi:hypothetical protein